MQALGPLSVQSFLGPAAEFLRIHAIGNGPGCCAVDFAAGSRTEAVHERLQILLSKQKVLIASNVGEMHGLRWGIEDAVRNRTRLTGSQRRCFLPWVEELDASSSDRTVQERNVSEKVPAPLGTAKRRRSVTNIEIRPTLCQNRMPSAGTAGVYIQGVRQMPVHKILLSEVSATAMARTPLVMQGRKPQKKAREPDGSHYKRVDCYALFSSAE